MMERWQFFHRSENKKFSKDDDLAFFEWMLPEGTSLASALAHAYADGLPKGSARAGCVEIQNDRGIYKHLGNSRIDVSTPARAHNVVFVTWDELDAAEKMGLDGTDFSLLLASGIGRTVDTTPEELEVDGD